MLVHIILSNLTRLPSVLLNVRSMCEKIGQLILFPEVFQFTKGYFHCCSLNEKLSIDLQPIYLTNYMMGEIELVICSAVRHEIKYPQLRLTSPFPHVIFFQ